VPVSLVELRTMTRQRTGTSKADTKDNAAAAVFLAPWLIGLFGLALGPMAASLYLSFTDYNLLQDPSFVGLDNLRRMISDDRLHHSLAVTFEYVLISVPSQLIVALLLALVRGEGIHHRTALDRLGEMTSAWTGAHRRTRPRIAEPQERDDMEHTWRWFGPRDPITLAEIPQTGATAVVTALHDIPIGEVWPVEAIAHRKSVIEAAGLTWSVVENLRTFLRHVVPVAAEAGVRLAIHPDDPPRPLLGLPRIVSTAADARWILEAVNDPANGLTLCVGSYGVRPDNDIVAMIREFGSRIYFTHLRSTRREADQLSFHEATHIDGDIDMVAIVRELVREERRRESCGGARLPMRPDHGHQMLYDQTNDRRTYPGYSLIGRMKGLAELRGVEKAVRTLEAPRADR
jgi:sugar phosphate isomerase/epimerase